MLQRYSSFILNEDAPGAAKNFFREIPKQELEKNYNAEWKSLQLQFKKFAGTINDDIKALAELIREGLSYEDYENEIHELRTKGVSENYIKMFLKHVERIEEKPQQEGSNDSDSKSIEFYRQQFDDIIIQNNKKPKDFRINVNPKFRKELLAWEKSTFYKSKKMYHELNSWLKEKSEKGWSASTGYFRKSKPMQNKHFDNMIRAHFSAPTNILVMFYKVKDRVLHLVALADHRSYMGSEAAVSKLGKTLNTRYETYMNESVSLKSFSQFLNEINDNRTKLLAPDPTREDLKKVSDANIQQILKKAKTNPRDLTQAEKHVLFALGKK
jgi:hypothetical protein